ncbi:Scr1 family TA system antitoxin-like transcriptional regulator [Streptomyces longwoodensis]|uniref:helix-turn-helix domain-containing protein n=1 Tax=Streptomyces longwoodensis TaxID=68231 RepID=UPI0037032467
MNARKLPPKKNLSSMKMLGRQLGTARRAAGLTQSALAEMVRLDEETIASIEQGRRSLKSDLAHLLDEILQTKGLLSTGVANLPETDQFPLWAEEYMEQEHVAIALSFYDNAVIPGLLQTAAFARCVLRNRIPAYAEEELETVLRLRIDRQEILQRTCPPTLSFMLWEPVLHLRIGTEETCKEQLRHLRTCSSLPNMSLQILPLDSPMHAGLDGPFTLLETPDHQHVAYTESQRGSQWVSSPEEVSILARRYAMLRTQAMTTQDSLRLLDRLLGER